MWQRTQQVVKLDDKVFALHNQRGFWRPLVTSTLTVVEAALQLMVDNDHNYVIDQNFIRHTACRPYGLPEYFKNHEPYPCKFPFNPQEHDNNDGWSAINIDLKNKVVGYQFYTSDWKKLGPLEYIAHVWCIDYCDQVWKEWYVKVMQNIEALYDKLKIECTEK